MVQLDQDGQAVRSRGAGNREGLPLAVAWDGTAEEPDAPGAERRRRRGEPAELTPAAFEAVPGGQDALLADCRTLAQAGISPPSWDRMAGSS